MQNLDATHPYEYFGEIVVIDSDELDNEIFTQVADELGLKPYLHIFSEGDAGIKFLTETPKKIGLIFCEIYLPKRTGMELKLAMREDEILRKKSIPFVLFSTVINPTEVETAYLELPVQGMFLKKSSYDEMKKMIEVALSYWSTCIHPQ